MAKVTRLAGSTSHILTIYCQDSSSTTGAGLTGLTASSSGLTCYYKRNTGTGSTAVTLTGTGTLGTYASGLFKEIDSANLPGFYEFHPPDAAYAAGAKSVAFLLKGATNLVPVPIEVELTAVDNQAASFGLSLAKTTNITGFNDVAATAIVSGGAITTASGKVSGVALVDTLTTYTGNTPQTGDAYARIGTNGAGLTALGDARVANLDAAVSSRMATYTQPTGFLAATFPATVASPTNITGGTITTVTNLTNAPTAGDFTATMKTSLNAATPASVVGAVGSVAGNVGGNVTGSVGSLATQAKADVAGAVWDAAQASHTTAGTFGPCLDAAVSSRLATSGYTAPLTATQVENAVWNAAHSAHTTAGTFGLYLDAAVSGVSTGGVSASAIATAVWQDLTAGSDFGTAGSVGALLKANLDAQVSTRSTYAGADTAGTTTLLSRLTATRSGYLDNLSGGAVALASQIPANFTTATFASAGVFSSGALANAPTGGGSAQTGDVYGLLNPLVSAGAFTGAALANAPKTGLALTSAYDPAKTAAQAGDAMTLTTAGYNAAADALLDRANAVETGETPRQWMRKVRAVLMGVCTAGGVFKRKDGTTTSLTVTLDGQGARTGVADGTN